LTTKICYNIANIFKQSFTPSGRTKPVLNSNLWGGYFFVYEVEHCPRIVTNVGSDKIVMTSQAGEDGLLPMLKIVRQSFCILQIRYKYYVNIKIL
jgi:hypothetical protein